MGYYKGLRDIGRTGEFNKISNELLKDYISDFKVELNSRSSVKKTNNKMDYLIIDNFGKVLKKANKEVESLNKGDYILLDDGNYNVTFKTVDYSDNIFIINVELDS